MVQYLTRTVAVRKGAVNEDGSCGLGSASVEPMVARGFSMRSY